MPAEPGWAINMRLDVRGGSRAPSEPCCAGRDHAALAHDFGRNFPFSIPEAAPPDHVREQRTRLPTEKAGGNPALRVCVSRMPGRSDPAD